MRSHSHLPLRLAAACAAILGTTLPAQSHGAAFALIEQGVVPMGSAYAGGAAQAEDPSTVYFNPAGMTRLKGTQIVGALHVVMPEADFSNEGSQHLFNGPPLNSPLNYLGNGDGGDGGETGIVPNFYITHRLSEQWAIGLGINAPFGLATEYDDDWVGRYHATRSEVKTINVNPSIAFEVNDSISLGAGISAQYIEAELSNAIDIGTINALPVALGGFGGAFNFLGLIPGGSDGEVTVEGDDWSWGFNLGALVNLNAQTRFGIHYRSKIEHTLTGTADFSIPGGGLIQQNTGLFRDTGVKSTVELPATLSVSAFHQINDEWAVMGDVTWTDWSSLPELRFDFDNSQPDGVTTLKWDDSYRFAIGAVFQPQGNPWTYRAGLAYDQSPVLGAEYRTPRIPDEDRVWLAVGLSYEATDAVTLDFGYAHLFVDDPKINKSAAGEDAVRGGLKGTYDAAVDLVSLQVRVAF
jgi:long-chain fatty acid transport protein